MTRERARELAPIIAAFGDGKDIETARVGFNNDWAIMDEPNFNGETLRYRIKPEFKRRAMTRNEVLGFISNTAGIVIRFETSPWSVGGAWNYDNICAYEWATIDAKGNIGEPHKFEVEE